VPLPEAPTRSKMPPARELLFGKAPAPAPPIAMAAAMFDSVAVELLNALLAVLFPLWPWEIFIVMPFVLAYYGPKRSTILFITIFGAVFCGVGHTAGLIQAIQTVLGGKGICVSALPGAPSDIDTYWMCQMMAVHIFLMVIMGYHFLFLALSDKKRVPDTGVAKIYYQRCARFFVIGGISQITPYVAVIAQYPERFGEFMAAPGFYSARWFSPGLTEFGEPIIWISMGLYFFVKSTKGASIDKLKLSPPVTPVGDDAQSLMSNRSGGSK